VPRIGHQKADVLLKLDDHILEHDGQRPRYRVVNLASWSCSYFVRKTSIMELENI
jgi:hypothetical protein